MSEALRLTRDPNQRRERKIAKSSPKGEKLHNSMNGGQMASAIPFRLDFGECKILYSKMTPPVQLREHLQRANLQLR